MGELKPSPLNSFFDKIVVLNLKSRPDRREQIEEELKSQNIKEIKFFEAFEGGVSGFNKTMFEILKENINTERLLIFEDDCYFIDSKNLNNNLRRLPNDWDIFSLGSNLRKPHIRYTSHLYELKDAWMTHAVGYSNKMIRWIVNNYNQELVYDEWLRLNVYPKFKCYMANPIVCWQRPNLSNLTNIHADYTDSLTQTKHYMI